MSAAATRTLEVLIAGCGAIGSRLVEALEALTAGLGRVRITLADRDRVEPANVGVAAFGPEDLGRPKTAVLAERLAARGGAVRALDGDLRYTLRPGLASRLDLVVLALDNPAALRDAAEAVWAGGRDGLLVLGLTCGGAEGGAAYLARHFLTPGLCPVCLFGRREHRADQEASTTSCADTTAPRASAVSAEAAARAGATLVGRWLDGDRSLAHQRVQSDGDGGAWMARMPDTPSIRCPVPHAGGPADARPPLVALPSIGKVTAGTLAGRAIAAVGADATILLGRRVVPAGGLYCPTCRATAAPPPLLLPAALAAAAVCECDTPPRPIAGRGSITARELLDPVLAGLSLAAWGAGQGDELLAVGARGRVRLRCALNGDD